MDIKTLKNLHLINETFAGAGQAELSRLSLAALSNLEAERDMWRTLTVKLSRDLIELEDELEEYVIAAAFG